MPTALRQIRSPISRRSRDPHAHEHDERRAPRPPRHHSRRPQGLRHTLTSAGSAPAKPKRDFARRIATSAGLRNRIVHDYDTIDPAKVYDALQGALADVREHLGAVRAWIERASRSEVRG
jgi:hypothetical protein